MQRVGVAGADLDLLNPAAGGKIKIGRQVGENVAALGGHFDAGGAPGGGFRVWASLPAAGR